MASIKKLLVFSAALLVLTTAGASAGPGKSKAKSRDQNPGHQQETFDRRDYSRLGDYERDLVRDYYGGADCPPGLAKKNNGCLPPGIAKKRYDVGRPLGGDVIIVEIPYELERRLPRLPREYGYRLIDGDLGVIELSTLIVLDAIGLY